MESWQSINDNLSASVLSWHKGQGDGSEYASHVAELRVCASATAGMSKISSDQWELRGRDGGGYPVDPPGLSVITTSPYFDASGDRFVDSSECADGWVSFRVPASFVPVTISFTADPQSSGDPDLAWTLD